MIQARHIVGSVIPILFSFSFSFSFWKKYIYIYISFFQPKLLEVSTTVRNFHNAETMPLSRSFLCKS
jgi:hypothetical protein